MNVDLSGDVVISNSRNVIASVFRRGYAAEEGRRFGLVTAPAVTVFEQPEVIRDPTLPLEAARVVELATDASVSEVPDWSEGGTRTVLGTEATLETATATADAGEVALDRIRVRTGEDAVTAMALTPAGVDRAAPFDAVARDG